MNDALNNGLKAGVQAPASGRSRTVTGVYFRGKITKLMIDGNRLMSGLQCTTPVMLLPLPLPQPQQFPLIF
ncbi:hypothetical protein V6N11_000261 [Hibiscus sabdariffa]|uniref:Uncharacterized protein n=1 Tax=Hibiscus sabdariffa TaxID=183260 RepID=A0ABR2A290_9ROSI